MKFELEKMEDWKLVAKELRKRLKPGDWVALEGELGAGKTSFVRSFLRELGYTEPVASPSYPLMIEYELDTCRLIHIDAFRLSASDSLPWDPQEWQSDWVFVEWPEKLKGSSDVYKYRLKIDLDDATDKRRVQLWDCTS